MIKRGRHKGQALIQALGTLFVTVMMGSFAVDSGLYYVVHQGMQNAADAAALAGAQSFFQALNTSSLDGRKAAAVAAAQDVASKNMSNQLNTTDVTFGYVDPISGQFTASSFYTPTTNPAFAATGGYNAIRVIVNAGDGQANGLIPSIFGKYFGRNGYNSAAQAIAIYGGGVYSAEGLRPVYMCQAAWDKAQQLYGDPTIPEITFYGDTLRVGTTNVSQASSCGSMGPGNWGISDLTNGNGSPGVSTVRDWFEHGFNGEVYTGTNYESQTGTPLNTFDDALNNLKTNATTVYFPLYDATSGNGSNAVFHVSQIAAFVITGYQTTGNQSQRYIKGYFKKVVCSSGCSLGTSTRGGGTTTLRLVH